MNINSSKEALFKLGFTLDHTCSDMMVFTLKNQRKIKLTLFYFHVNVSEIVLENKATANELAYWSHITTPTVRPNDFFLSLKEIVVLIEDDKFFGFKKWCKKWMRQ